MTITSLYYFIFLATGVLLYYIVPKKIQWFMLLLLSVVFYVIVANPLSILYLIGATLVAYISTLILTRLRTGEDESARSKAVVIIAVVILTLTWFIPRGTAFWSAGKISIIGALGMGYYTLQVIAYILDVYRGNIEPQRNILKLFLFVSFFPQMTVGPISKYSELESLFEGHSLSYRNITYGAQRILWGLMKKLVLSDRIGFFISSVWNDPVTFNGFWIWFAVILYPLQLYTDFSGCMDIVLGTAEMLDIHLPENFNNPYFAITVKEFWRRWHITLSRWFRDYVYIPLGGNRKGRTRKYINTLIVFVLSGVWHGNMQYVLGFGLYYWILITLSEVLHPVFEKINAFLHVDPDSFSWKTFQRIRTYMFYVVGTLCFSTVSFSQLFERLRLLKHSVENLQGWTLFDGTLFKSGLTNIDLNLFVLSVLLLIAGDTLRERFGYARHAIARQGIIFRWLVWIGLFVLVLIYGMYGPGFDAATFIYQGF